MKNQAIPIVMIALIGFCIFAPVVSAETAEEWSVKGFVFAMSGEYEKAIECFDKAIELNPNDVNIYYNRGCAYFYLKQYGRAIEDFNKTIELNPNHTKAYYKREIALNKLGDGKGVPGFESIFAITGLLVVTYLLRRRK